jgi:enoyl-CoA hydratase/carnithine racemase
MSNLNVTTEQFESRLVGNIVNVHLKCDALDIVTEPAMNEDFYDLLQSINQSSELRGYVQINDSEWKLLSDSEALAQFISQDNEEYVRHGRYYGYLHDIIAARFRNSIGRLLLTFMDHEKPTVAGLQGKITGEYLGLTLAFDARFATADTVIVFNNVRTGWPGSPGLTHLMPRYIGISRALSLIHRGATIDAHEAYALGLVAEIVDTHQDLVDRCKKEILDISGDNRHLVKLHRQEIFPPVDEVRDALERYYDGMANSVLELRKSATQG